MLTLAIYPQGFPYPCHSLIVNELSESDEEEFAGDSGTGGNGLLKGQSLGWDSALWKCLLTGLCIKRAGLEARVLKIEDEIVRSLPIK